MLFAPSDQRVLGYLGRALSLELTAFQQYSTQARLAATWGLAEVAERLHREAGEEREHVDRIIARMLALGAAPNASRLRPVRFGPNVPALLLENQALENALIQLYEEACGHCAMANDHDNRLFFETLLGEERRHAEALETWIGELTLRRESTSGKGATF